MMYVLILVCVFVCATLLLHHQFLSSNIGGPWISFAGAQTEARMQKGRQMVPI